MTLRDLVKRHEGLRLKPYRDTLGKLTIGYGRCLDTAGISQSEADLLLDADLTRATTAAFRVFGPDFSALSGARQAAFVSMAFQLGEAGLAGFRDMLGYARGEEWTKAAGAALNSKWAQQAPRRAREIAAMIETGEW